MQKNAKKMCKKQCKLSIRVNISNLKLQLQSITKQKEARHRARITQGSLTKLKQAPSKPPQTIPTIPAP